MLEVDIESIVRSQDLIYENAGTCWQDGHILGNGDMGVVCYAPYWLEWTVNKVDVFDGRNAPKKKLTYRKLMAEVKRRGAKNLQFLPEIEKPDTSNSPLEPLLKSCGQVKIRTTASVDYAANEYSWVAPRPYKVRQVLSLWEAKDCLEMNLAGSFGLTEPSSPRVESFVSRESNLLVIKMRNASAPMLQKRLELCRPFDYDLKDPEFGSENNLAWFHQKMPDGTSYAMAMGAVPSESRFCRKAKVKAGINGIEHKGDRIWLNLTGDFDLFVSTATSYESSSPLSCAKEIVARGMQEGADRLEKEHSRWWQNFWKKSFVQLEDHPIPEQLWYFGLYQAGSALKRAPVPGLCGLWYGHQDLPRQGLFNAVYTMDQNVQIHTLPVFCVNHPELALPFMDTFLNALPETVSETKKMFDLPGACYPLEMKFMGGEPSFGSDYRLSLCGGPFCGIIYVWAYRYTRDKKLLREKIYPFLREIVRFFSAFMEKDRDGRYHLPLTVPAEIFTLSRDAIADISLLKPCLQLAIEASKLFNLDSEERKGWEDLLANYPAYPTKQGIIMDGADIPLDHPSQLTFRLYPVVLAHEKEEAVWKTVERTLDHIIPYFQAKVRAASCLIGYTPAITRKDNKKKWRAAGWLWFFFTRTMLMYGRKKEIMPLLYEELRAQLKPNGLFPHLGIGMEVSENPQCRELCPATPENNSTVMMIITEVLMQSYHGLIRLFPGLTGKATARFGNLRAEGAFLVSSEMVKGKVTFVSITAEKGGTAKVKNPWSGKVLSLPLKEGETTILGPEGKKMKRKRVASKRQACPKAKVFGDRSLVRLGK